MNNPRRRARRFLGGFYYPDNTRVHLGDRVFISQKMADTHANGERKAEVIGLHGFVTVLLSNGERLDLDMRSISKESTSVKPGNTSAD